MTIENLFNLYNKYGKYDYIGEDVSQIEHMIQAAMITASKQTLKEQGGPMTKQQAENFENDELFEVSLKMRIYDEKAKIKNMKINSIDYYFDKINKYLLLQTI